MFGNWLRGVDKLDKVQIRVGVRALLWSLWNSTNYSVLNKTENFNLLQGIHKTSYLIYA